MVYVFEIILVKSIKTIWKCIKLKNRAGALQCLRGLNPSAVSIIKCVTFRCVIVILVRPLTVPPICHTKFIKKV